MLATFRPVSKWLGGELRSWRIAIYSLTGIFLSGYMSAVNTTAGTQAFSVLAEPARRRVLDLLLDGPRPVGELAGLLGLSQPGTSKHLRVLREAGLVRVRQDGQRRWYELRPDPLAEIDTWLQPYRKFWASHLDALERYLDNDEREG
jgi:DNA-binding transcriptional ArsR family regulator